MLNYLYEVEKKLSTWLKEPIESWNSLFVDYHDPYVERVWRQDGDNRVYLHRIHRCLPGKAPLFHPHPWPSAMKILKNDYVMEVGYGSGITPPDLCMKLIMTDGSYYEMNHFDGWHSVAPIEEYSYSLMVTGKPWEREIPMGLTKKLEPLSSQNKIQILNFFKTRYFDVNFL